MRGTFGRLLLLASAFVGSSQAACSADLVVDNYSKYASNTNSLGSWTSDDGSMTSITASAAAKKLTFTPKAGSSYFYTTFNCLAAPTEGYNAISFPFKAPKAGTTVLVEIQTSASCSATAYTSSSFKITGLGTTSQTITIPLSSFAGANTGAIKAIIWSQFSATGSYELGQTQFVCAGGASSVAPSSTAITSSAPSASNSSVPVIPNATTTVSPTATATSSPTGTCNTLLIDDWESQSRLTFLFYNAMLKSSSDDGSMKSIVVANNHVTFNSKSGSYFYSSFDCLNAANKYGGISLRIKAPAGTTFTVELQSSDTCSSAAFKGVDKTTTQLGWKFDGTEKLYNIPFSTFTGLDTSKLTAILFQSFSGTAVTFGPMAFYCGSTPVDYIPPPTTTAVDPTATVPVTSATASALVIDQFANPDSNALGFWHGGDDDTGLKYSGGKLTIKYTDTDYAFYTQMTGSCRDMTAYENAYLHIAYTGSNLFTIAVQQHNSACNDAIAPYPETWDDVEARRYASATDIYVPISHFGINKSRVIGIALKAFTSTTATVLSKIEIVKTVPKGTIIPSKIPTAPLVFACKRPNSFAFAIDDGSPEYAQQVMKIIKEENIKVTFFTVGAPLLDTSTNLSNVYTEMLSQGHQVALHSFTHPKMESLPTVADIDWELQQDIDAVSKTLKTSSKYFRPPFGNEGARMRQRLQAKIPGSQVINWSVDVEDWLWAESATPEKQLDAFKRDVAKGGNLVVMHYLYPSTVGYLKQFIQLAKATGKTLMRVDQCMMDPDAPAL